MIIKKKKKRCDSANGYRSARLALNENLIKTRLSYSRCTFLQTGRMPKAID